ncbi:hypothetical protein SAMN05421810_11076 [Amycolatopsis arida]|uniref:XRE family transcriptional regulator n=1 Tax=Amycolatopsis arida TaxID=587909 RepID=A0A1I5ZRD2_9PSEU|nr:hypothetical protein [Amycolatopsis arida]TDX89309.1 hypothetical protein CLV69_11076 [Amycolatopsis arida]SFQ58995.1 hypothetical protein SAMN05421810_11076 [Amycolatopsis arida]
MSSQTVPARGGQRSPDVDLLLHAGPFHAALRAAIEDSGLTLEGVRHRLAQRGIRVSLASLSYWQQGRSRPERADSLRAVRAIEHILGLPAHSLAALLGPPRPRGRWTRRNTPDQHYDGLLEPAAALAQTVRPVLGPSDHKLRVFSQEDRVRVGADRAIRVVRTSVVVRALEDDPDRFLAVYCAEPGSRAGDILPSAGENCRLGRVRRHPHAPVIAIELLFDRRLRAGETHLFDYQFTIDSAVPSVDYRRGFRYPGDSYVLGIRFAEESIPVRCFAFTQHEPHGGSNVDGELPVTPGRWVHRVARDLRPGVLGVRWEWE